MTWLQTIQQTWRQPHHGMSRDSRDTLWLLMMLALVIAPHAPHLPWWSSLGAIMALVWRARAAWLQSSLPSRSWLIFLLLTLLTLTWLTYGTLIGRQAGITLVVVLATLKSLELKARRDALVCMYLGFFLIFTQFLFSQGIGTALLMFLSVWGLLCALMLGQRPLGYPRMREVGVHALRATLWGIPMMVMLFVLFPRIGPLWSLPSDSGPKTGLSDSLVLGDVAQLAQDNRIALRIKFLDAKPPSHNLYFRGPILEQFDGKKWIAEKLAHDETSNFRGKQFPYLMTIEPFALQVVPLIEGTEQANVVQPPTATNVQRFGMQWWRGQKSEQRLQIAAMAYSHFSHGPLKADDSLQRWKFLPPLANPRTRQWALAWAQSEHSKSSSASPTLTTRELTQALLAYIRSNDYRYTLSPGRVRSSEHTIDDFWIDRKSGFCEHFASSFVMIMRVLGIPARIVTGYQGAEQNPIDGLYVVRNSNAHAWAEVWMVNEGWIRIDPTAAVAPERVDHSPPLRPFAGLPGPLGELDPQTIRRLRMTWEAIDNRWNQWVLQYSNEQQMNLLRSLGWESPDWEALGQVLASAMAVMALGSALLLKIRQGKSTQSIWNRQLMRMDRALHKLAPLLEHSSPQPASFWHAQLQQQWGSNDKLSSKQQALLQSLLDLDDARYGAKSVQSTHKLPSHVLALIHRIERLSKDCHSDIPQPSPK